MATKKGYGQVYSAEKQIAIVAFSFDDESLSGALVIEHGVIDLMTLEQFVLLLPDGSKATFAVRSAEVGSAITFVVRGHSAE
jgi:hypothetical protein